MAIDDVTSTPVSKATRALWSLAGPRGPLREPTQDAHDHRVLTHGDPLEAAERVLEALRFPSPPPELDRADLEVVAADVLSELLQPAVERLLVERLADPTVRGAILGAFAFGCSTATTAALIRLVQCGAHSEWDDDHIVMLVDALWTAGSEDAVAALVRLRDSGRAGAVRDELDKALADLD